MFIKGHSRATDDILVTVKLNICTWCPNVSMKKGILQS